LFSGWSFAPDLTGELTALSRSLAGERGGERKGRGGRGRQGRGRRGREGRCLLLSLSLFCYALDGSHSPLPSDGIPCQNWLCIRWYNMSMHYYAPAPNRRGINRLSDAFV